MQNFDIFSLRDEVINAYADYTRSFLQIRNPDINSFVSEELNKGKLWPDALLQISPAYLPGPEVSELVRSKILHPLCEQIFRTSAGSSMRLYWHQREAIRLANENRHFVVTTGTGSGKSMTYIIPIVNHVLSNNPEQGKVRAIIVYPMNALINSQQEALTKLCNNLPLEQRNLVRFDRYTGQESSSEKLRIQEHPPHILLTNYVMLELMLTRPDEYRFIAQGYADLRFIVLDELHTYRGRQGADVALLMRRVRERSGNADILCIGTSATMVSGTETEDRRIAVANVAKTIFGVPFEPDQVIEETLERICSSTQQHNPTDLVAALNPATPLPTTWQELTHSALTDWIEKFYSVNTNKADGRLQRVTPRTLRDGATQLAAETGLPVTQCEERLKAFLQAASALSQASDDKRFAFKVHQFISQGSAVYTTLEPKPYRTLEPGYFAGGSVERLLFPLVFCRECGQEYALCSYDKGARRLRPRVPMSRGEDVPEGVASGYLLLGEDAWSSEREEQLPEQWFTKGKNPRLRLEYQPHVPQELWVQPDGNIVPHGSGIGWRVWFMAMPLLFCAQCGVIYTRRNTDDFRKLARLSSEGRSTATTLITSTTVQAMQAVSNTDSLSAQARKLLSFTDNRQDASLQAGHFNDFVQVVLLRSALAKAVSSSSTPLGAANVAAAVVAQLDLPEAAIRKPMYDKDGQVETQLPPLTEAAQERVMAALHRLIEYRLYEDLRRGWRITMPNLEQVGLLKIGYRDLEKICADEQMWRDHPILAATPSPQRYRAIYALLEYMRRNLAIDAAVLKPEQHKHWQTVVQQHLSDDLLWSVDEQEQKIMRVAGYFVLDGQADDDRYTTTLGSGSAVGRFLRSPDTWVQLNTDNPLAEDAYLELRDALLRALISAEIITQVQHNRRVAYQLRHDALLWSPGDGTVPPPDPIRWKQIRDTTPAKREANRFFQQLYRQADRSWRILRGHEHTGQVAPADRQQRESEFRAGNLPVLFCSPTMELGIDISDLNVVHMRNVPPTPANYAQRSGRAGRSGQAALVLTYASTGSAHDQYFFAQPHRMVAGVVAPPQIELANEDLIRAHIHAVWLSQTGLDLGKSMLEIIDISTPDLPLHALTKQRLALTDEQRATCRATAANILAVLDLQHADWYTDTWLDDTLTNALKNFDLACDRWRELYRNANKQLEDALAQIRILVHQPNKKRELNDARWRQRDAEHELQKLGNNASNQSESEFYPYRYLASEGFLPGYNFPRLPVRAVLSTSGDEIAFLSRPRFLALREFGPHNIIYHEGRKYRIERMHLPTGNQAEWFRRASVCTSCGYYHEGQQSDLCRFCARPLAPEGTLINLLEMTTVTARQIERITSDEEERMREGYHITTHYAFARGPHGLRCIHARTNDGWMHLTYAPAATICRINRGWKHSRVNEPAAGGYTLDLQTGQWKQLNTDDPAEDKDSSLTQPADPLQRGVRLMVQDTRNLLVVQLVVQPDGLLIDSAETLISLQYALQRSIEQVFQLEEQELASEQVGNGSNPRILFWEASEGGAGVLRRLVEEPSTLARVAQKALEICHFSLSESAAEGEHCSRACYRCLLSYANQPVHQYLNRHAIYHLLNRLAQLSVMQEAADPVAPELATLLEAAPTPFVKQVLEQLAATRRRLPDAVGTLVQGQPVDLYYRTGDGNATAVLCIAAGEPTPATYEALLDVGVNVVLLHAEHDLEQQFAKYQFWAAGG